MAGTGHGTDSSGGIVIYDGDCSFCVARAGKLRALTAGNVRLEPLQTHNEAASGVPRERLQQEITFIRADGQVFGGADALVRLVSAGRAWQAWALRLYGLPGIRPLAARLYRLVARNRRRL